MGLGRIKPPFQLSKDDALTVSSIWPPAVIDTRRVLTTLINWDADTPASLCYAIRREVLSQIRTNETSYRSTWKTELWSLRSGTIAFHLGTCWPCVGGYFTTFKAIRRLLSSPVWCPSNSVGDHELWPNERPSYACATAAQNEKFDLNFAS